MDNRKLNIIGLISVISMIISIYVAYKTALKPFNINLRIDPQLQIQHRTNFGIYVNADFINNSPQEGTIRQLAIITYNNNSKENKYLLTLFGFMTRDTSAVYHYSSAEEQLPIFLKPWSHISKAISFIYQSNEPFPITMGTYECLLLIWTNDNEKASFSKTFRFEVGADLLDKYKMRREKQSTTLEAVSVVGYVPIESKKLTEQEYKQLF